ncbi:MAG: hypothetical protein WC358_03835 [Ignavibacteria bacterium]
MRNPTIILFVLLIILLITKNILAQSDGPRDMTDGLINPCWEYYSDNMISSISAGKGYTGVSGLGDLSSLTLNPAAVNIEKKYQIYIGYAYKTDINFTNVFNYTPTLKNSFPSGIIGGVYRINKNFQTGFVYRNDYGYQIEYNNNSNSYYNIKNKLVTHNFTVPIIYNYEWFRAGVNLNLTYFRGEASGIFSTEFFPEGYYDEAHSNLLRIIPQIGVIINPIKEFSFGITFIPGFTDSTKYHYNVTTPSERNLLVRYPWRLGVGTEVKLLNNRLKLSLDYRFDKTSIILNTKDKSNFNFGVEYQIKNNVAIRGGFFTLLDFRDLSNILMIEEDNNSYDQYFITLGGTYKYKGYSFSLALMDSHLAKNNDVSHTKINGGISLDF